MTEPRWERLPRENSKHEDGVQRTASRLDVLFSEDLLMQMLDPRLRTLLVDWLAQNNVGWSPEFTKRALQMTPYAKLWSEEFIAHIESLTWIASGRKPQTEEN